MRGGDVDASCGGEAWLAGVPDWLNGCLSRRPSWVVSCFGARQWSGPKLKTLVGETRQPLEGVVS